jgi:hypothetical protein
MFRLLRIIPILLLIVILITVLRSVIGTVMKMFGNIVSGPASASNGAKRPTMQVNGELHRDPVCGTFVAGSTAFQRQDAKQTFYYCSETCRAQHALVSR